MSARLQLYLIMSVLVVVGLGLTAYKHITLGFPLVPGVEEGDIDLQAHDGVLTLKGEKKTEREEKGETWYFSERQYGAFSRSFRLPPDADEANVSAELKDGVLHVSVPKTAPEVPEAKKVKISKS